jgi:hypothetical protein
MKEKLSEAKAASTCAVGRDAYLYSKRGKCGVLPEG